MAAVPNIVLYAASLIGVVFGTAGLLSGFCLTSGLRNWWQEGDGRLIRSFALALAIAIAGTQALAGAGLVDLGQSIYLQPSFSAALILFGGLLFGYGMVAANACVSRALILLGRGNLRSLVVVIVVGVTAQMTLKGLAAPLRLAFLRWSEITLKSVALPDIMAAHGLDAALARLVAAAVVSVALLAFALTHAPFRKAYGLVAASVVIGLLIPAGWFATGYLGADPFNPAPVGSLTFVAPSADSLQYVMFSTGSTLSFGVVVVAGVLAWQLRYGAGHAALCDRGLHLGPAHAALDRRRGTDGLGRRHGIRLHHRAGTHRPLNARAAVRGGGDRNPARRCGGVAQPDAHPGARERLALCVSQRDAG